MTVFLVSTVFFAVWKNTCTYSRMSHNAYKIRYLCNNTDMEQLIKERFGQNVRIAAVMPVSGGDINRAYKAELSSGEFVFIKINSVQNQDFFRAETEALAAIAGTGTISTPEVFGFGTEVTGKNPFNQPCSFLLLEYLPPVEKQPRYWENFGCALASFHAFPPAHFVPAGVFGFSSDNYIGATPQYNTPAEKWIDFFREYRLKPQLQMAARYLSRQEQETTDRLMEKLEALLPEPSAPSLLHGDLWRGNVYTGPDGKAWLIDPASYVGHREADIAMTKLFGGFPRIFYESYCEICPLLPDFQERIPLYNLYHLLNHLNLFGTAYLGDVLDVIHRYG